MNQQNQNRILIVDDDSGIREVYAELFRKNGFEVLEAKDGIEGMDQATRQEGLDVIFTGIIMPRMDGFQMVKALKDYANTSQIPVVVNSHLGREEDREKMLALGAKDFIIQSVVPADEVVKRIWQVIKQGEYWFRINPLEMDAQQFIQDFRIPEDFHCSNCGTEIGMKAKFGADGNLSGQMACPNCGKKY